MDKLYNVSSIIALKVILWMYKHRSNNVINLPTADRQQLMKDLNISTTHLSKILKELKDNSIITGDRGKFYLDNEIINDLQTR